MHGYLSITIYSKEQGEYIRNNYRSTITYDVYLSITINSYVLTPNHFWYKGLNINIYYKCQLLTLNVY